MILEILINLVKNPSKIVINRVLHPIRPITVKIVADGRFIGENIKSSMRRSILMKLKSIINFKKTIIISIFLNRPSHRAFNIFTAKSTIGYNLGPLFGVLDVKHGHI